MILGDTAYSIGFLIPEAVAALLFYRWYFRNRGPALSASKSELRRHKIKAIVFSILVFVVVFLLAAKGAHSNG